MSKAADALDLSVSAVSRHLMNLEQRLGARLIHRSTRQLYLTSEGERFWRRCGRCFPDVREAEESVTSTASNPRGTLRVGVHCPSAFCILCRSFLLFERVTRKSGSSSSRRTATRHHRERNGRCHSNASDRSRHAITIRRLAQTRRLLAASPAYLEAHGVPEHPEDLTQHDLILYTLADIGRNFISRKGRGPCCECHVRGAHDANDGQLIRAAALDGLGFSHSPPYIIHDDLDRRAGS